MRTCYRKLLILVLVFAHGTPATAETTSTHVLQVLTRAHAHNDYEHPRPLLDALEHGFTSVEADIHLLNGDLYVAHDLWSIRPSRTLEALYLQPFSERIQSNSGYVYRESSQSLQLLIDIKTASNGVYPVLDRILRIHANEFTEFHDDGTSVSRAITVVLSGERPSIEMLKSQSIRYAALDGRLPEMSTTIPLSLMPLVSAAWESHFRWNGKGAMPGSEQSELRVLVARVHEQQRQIRFWGSPDTPECWEVLLNAGVDYLNTDDLAGMQRFLTSKDR